MSLILRTAVVIVFAVLLATAFTQEIAPGEAPGEAAASEPDESVSPNEQSDAPEEQLDEDIFGTFVRSRSVILDKSNGIDGAIGTLDRETREMNPTAALSVDLYDAGLERIKSVTTDGQGRFRFDDLSGGMYQLVAKGENGFLAFSLMVMERGLGPEDDLGQRDEPLFLVQAPMNTQETINFVSAAVPPTFRQVNSILKLHYGLTVPTYMMPGRPVPDFVNTDSEPQPANVFDHNSPLAREAVRTYEVPLLEDNRIKGRLYTLDPNSGAPLTVARVYVHIIRDDKPIGPPIPVNKKGEFEAELPNGAGAYSIVAAGKDGFGAAGFYARPQGEMESAHEREGTFLVTTELAQVAPFPAPVAPFGRANPRQMLTLALVSPNVIQNQMPAAAGRAIGNDLGVAVLPPPADIPVGGGGSSGGGGLGALLVGSGVVAAIAISTDDDDRRQTSPFSRF